MIRYDAVGYKTADKNGGGKWDQVYKVCPDSQQNLAWSSYKSNDNLTYFNLSCTCKSLLVTEMLYNECRNVLSTSYQMTTSFFSFLLLR